MSFLTAIILGVFAVELLLRLSLLKTTQKVMAAGQRSLEIVRSHDITEEAKPAFLLRCAGSSFLNTCLLALQLLVWGAALAAIFWVLSRILTHDSRVLYEPAFLLSATAASVVYALLRRHIKTGQQRHGAGVD